jgi:hypothetical protein
MVFRIIVLFDRMLMKLWEDELFDTDQFVYLHFIVDIDEGCLETDLATITLSPHPISTSSLSSLY